MAGKLGGVFGVDRGMRRGPFLLWGVGLMAVKVALDAAIFAAMHREYRVDLYVNPMASTPWVGEGQLDPVMAVVFAASVPFMAAGVVLTVRRLRDAGLPRGLAVLFFVPLAKFLFFAVCAAAPTAQAGEVRGVPAGPYRETRFVLRPVHGKGAAFVIASICGAVVSLGMMGTSVWAFEKYAFGVFFFAPAIAGFVAGLVVHKVSERATGKLAVLAALGSYLVSMVGVVVFSAEGAMCLLMASPLLAFSAAFGGVIGHVVGTAVPRGNLMAPGASALVLLPLSLLAERAAPAGDLAPSPVESVVEIDAPPEVVWRRVLSFPPLEPPTELPFRMGIAAPLRATIDGQGVGAVRRCEFTTGTFVEPIDTWVENRDLSFSVSSQPDPMTEQTLYAGPRPPHLDGYLRSTRGQFLLEPLPGGRTRLTGRTWYEVHMSPAVYWRFLSDRIIHAIHLRVLGHIARLSEADARQ